MPRLPRIEFEGACYHVFSRGNNRQPIFYTDKDRLYFLKNLESLKVKLQVKIYAFCLLTTHFHLLLETEKANLSTLMQNLLTNYASYFRRQYRTDGHIFHGRYHAILCDRDSYFLQLTRYIHLNPYHAGLCSVPEDYPWSSLRAYLKLPCSYPVKVDIDLALKLIGDANSYRRFIWDEVTGVTPVWKPEPRSNFLGSTEFLEMLLDKLKSRGWTEESLSELSERLRSVKEIPLPGLIQRVCEFYKITPEDLRSTTRRRKVAKARGVLIYLAKENLGLKISSLKNELAAGESTFKRWVRLIRRDEKLQREAKEIMTPFGARHQGGHFRA